MARSGERRDRNEKGYSNYLRRADFCIAGVCSELVPPVYLEIKSHDDQNAAIESAGCRTVTGYVFTHIDVPGPSKKLLRSDFS